MLYDSKEVAGIGIRGRSDGIGICNYVKLPWNGYAVFDRKARWIQMDSPKA